jgi:hypothetical protein
MRHIGIGFAGVVLVAGCGPANPVGADDAPASPYDGPMSMPIDSADDATVMEQSGAAGQALECDGEPYRGGSGSYHDGLATVQSTAERAIDNYLIEDGLVLLLPTEGLPDRTGGRRKGAVLL